MKKITILFIVGILVGSTLGVAGIQTNQQAAKSLSQHLSTPQMQIQSTSSEYIMLELEGSSTYLSTAGHPRLPEIIQVVELPFGSAGISVLLTPQDITTQQIDKQIEPAAALLPLTAEYQSIAASATMKDESIYAMTTPYPTTWYTTRTSVGLNKDNQHVTFLAIHYYPIRYTPATGTLQIAQNADVEITYTPLEKTPFPTTSSFDLVIIAPTAFESALQPLVDHKNNHGVRTYLKTTEDIYDGYIGFDKPEQIKNFIKDAIESQGITAVMLVGGVKNMFMSKPRDDANQGSKGWWVPVRYTNLYDNPKFPLAAETVHDPGVLSDLYYADIYEAGGAFSSWDPNNDHVFSAWNMPGVEDDPALDLSPDIAIGRLACTSVSEVQVVVNKIITYETTTYGAEWFKKMIVVSGDGFLDQEDLNILWDTKSLPTGIYTIHDQGSNPSAQYGPIETINVTVDKTKETTLTFNHDDNLRIHSYPGLPMAEICTVTEGNVLGNTDFTYTPGESEAYCNEFYFWANMSYVNGVLTIRGKSYDPVPYGNLSSIHVWITNSADKIVFEDWRNNTEMYYEGEYTVGERALLGRGGGLYYMPSEFERDILWASNGKYTGSESIINAWDEGAGFIFCSGHGSPNTWGDQYPGIPGNRKYGSVGSLSVTNLKPWAPFVTTPVFPIDTINNGQKLPIAVIGGCHNSEFNVSVIYCLLDVMHILPKIGSSLPNMYMWTYGAPVPECFSWRLVRNPNGGAIASIGNTGLGYGMPGIACTTGGGDSWVTIEIFRQYGALGIDNLGLAHQQVLSTYVNTFDMSDMEAGHVKSVQQWALLGDPTLKIGGYQ
jgi:hypothetical protein